MRTHNMPLINIRKENHPNLSQSAWDEFFPRDSRMSSFETAVVNEPSVFEPLKFYCVTFPRQT